MIKIENERKRVSQINTSMNAGELLHSHLKQNNLVIDDRQYKKKQLSNNELNKDMSNKTSQDQLSYNRESLRQSNINSFNYQPFKNESDIDYSSLGD